jgi:geranylgeranyl pyrophosphate synthase
LKKRDLIPEQALRQVQRIFKQKGTKTLEMARKEITGEEIESKDVREAINYFMTKSWKDVSRPSLMSLVCESFGGSPDLTNPFAVSMTLISAAMAIHDDIIDQSRSKYGQPTVLGKYGRGFNANKRHHRRRFTDPN